MTNYLKEYKVSDYFKYSNVYSWKLRLNDFQLIHIDENCKEITGYNPIDFLENKIKWLDTIHPDDLKEFLKARDRVSSNAMVEIDFRSMHKNGEYKWYNNKYMVVDFPNPEDSLIVGMTTDITENKNVETYFENRIKLEEILARTSASFVKIDHTDFERHVNSVLENIGTFANTDRAYIFLYHNELMSNTHEWVAEGISEEKENLQDIPIKAFPWWAEMMQENKNIYLSTLDDLPEEAVDLRESLEAQNIKSLLAVPLTYESEVIGFMGFDAVKNYVQWSEKNILLLRTISEITASAIKRVEYAEKLKESELRFRQMADNIAEVFYLTDPIDNNTLYISKAFEEVWGLPVDLIYSNMPAFIDSIDGEYREEVINALNDQSKGLPTEIEYKINRPDGTQRWIRDRAYPIFDEANKLVRITGIADDITKYKYKEEELRISEEHYKSLIESSDAIIMLFNRQHEITFANKITIDKFNTSYNAIIGKKIEDLLSVKDVERYKGTFENVFCTNKAIVLETELTINEEKIWTRNSIVPIRDNNGIATQLLINSLDITELKKAQEKVNRSNVRLKGMQLVDRAIIQGELNTEPAEIAALRYLNQMIPCEELNIVIFDDEHDKALVPFRILNSEENFKTDLELPLSLFIDNNLIVEHPITLQINEKMNTVLYEIIKDCNYKSALQVPMMVHGNNIGVLILFSKTDEFFNNEYIDISEEVANQIALSIYHANLYRQIQQYSEQLEVNVQERTKDIILVSNTFKAIMNNTDISIIIVDEHGLLIECNPVTSKRCGLPTSSSGISINTEIINDLGAKIKMHEELMLTGNPEDISSLEMFKIRSDRGFSNAFEWKYKGVKGEVIPVILTVNSLKIDETDNKRYVLIASDITEQKNAEAQLKETLEKEIELGKFKSSFVTTASHQFRTPLTSIQTSMELIAYYLQNVEFDKKNKTFNHISLISSEIHKLSDLMTDILTIGKIEEGKVPCIRESLDFKLLIKEIIDTYFNVRPDGRKVEFSCVVDNYTAFVDKRLISHSILNLLSNAFKYSNSNPQVKLYKHEDRLYLEVVDNGIGIPENEIQNLFQSFYRASNSGSIEGTGLGLAIVKEFLALNNAEIKVQSKLEKGTTFTIVI